MNKGKLYLVTTPIGNLNDFSKRSIDILNSVEYIYCEDTRTSKVLLNHYKIDTKLKSLHMFNESKRKEELLFHLNNQKDLAIISDAGTPLISDPGSKIVSFLKKNEIEIFSVGQNSAFLAALITSGINFDSFSFLGFAPRESSKLNKVIFDNLNVDAIIFYESPKRIINLLNNLKNLLGDIEVSISREISKIYEETTNDKISNLLLKKYRGEIVIVIPTIEYKQSLEFEKIIKKAKELVSKNIDKKTISKILQTNNIKQNQIYKEIKND